MKNWFFKVWVRSLKKLNGLEKFLSWYDFKDLDWNGFEVILLLRNKILQLNSEGLDLGDAIFLLNLIPKQPDVSYNEMKGLIELELGEVIRNKLFDELSTKTSYVEILDLIKYVAERTAGYQVSPSFVLGVFLPNAKKLAAKKDAAIIDELLILLKPIMDTNQLKAADSCLFSASLKTVL